MFSSSLQYKKYIKVTIHTHTFYHFIIIHVHLFFSHKNFLQNNRILIIIIINFILMFTSKSHKVNISTMFSSSLQYKKYIKVTIHTHTFYHFIIIHVHLFFSHKNFLQNNRILIIIHYQFQINVYIKILQSKHPYSTSFHIFINSHSFILLPPEFSPEQPNSISTIYQFQINVHIQISQSQTSSLLCSNKYPTWYNEIFIIDFNYVHIQISQSQTSSLLCSNKYPTWYNEIFIIDFNYVHIQISQSQTSSLQ